MTDTPASSAIVQITVLIAGRPYLLKVNAADEALVHRLAQEVNDKVAAFKTAQPTKDQQDCLAMALLTYAVDHYRNNEKLLLPSKSKP